MIEFPKIETLFDRNDNFSVDVTRIRVSEFENIKHWHITEKIDGTNVRIGLRADGSVEFSGRTDNSQMPMFLAEYLRKTFTPEKVQAAFEAKEGAWPEVVLFGEGYGSRIQKGGGNYRKDVAFRLFDVLVGKWWLSPENVFDVAEKLGIRTVPYICVIDFLPHSQETLSATLHAGIGLSAVAQEENGLDIDAEGIVARAYPMLFFANNRRCMWKLKFSDFRNGKAKARGEAG